jgi:hypothetical protein
MITFLRPLSEQPPDEDDTDCVMVKNNDWTVMHFLVRNGARVKSPAPDPQKAEAE